MDEVTHDAIHKLVSVCETAEGVRVKLQSLIRELDDLCNALAEEKEDNNEINLHK